MYDTYFNKDDHLDMNFDMLTAYIQEEKEELEQHGLEIVGRHSYKFLKDTAFNFIAAGRDTVSAEMRDQRDGDDGDDEDGGSFFDAQQVRKLVYLQAALCETLRRLYPPVPRNHKAPSQPDTLPSGHLLKGNQTVLLSFYAMGRMED
ncbi:hypothetical protein FNV43_RR24789 [Rhamnella rubrinervis]|uniref:Uncharacterized protein n=1 Tax=Rhamnella rubrinervis TaxID=2594499 RepID=A0A8K0DNG4_9ROSA|nr:hypothetical protein FNV43_RR24789 [Rhamnella rubrinervis]